MATQTDNNGGLYFIVGGLVVVVAVIGYFYMAGNDVGSADAPTIIERTERTIERATDTDNDTSSNSLEMRVDENGASATTTQSD